MSDNLPIIFKSNLPADYSGLDEHDLLEATGMSNGDLGLGLPSLRVNYDDQDEDENSIPRGHWTITVDGVRYFAKEVFMRIMNTSNQYSHYDADQGKTIAKSIHFNRFGEEVYDDAGGFKCGKVSRKAFEKMNDADKARQKKIKLAKVLFGFVSIETGVDVKGKPARLDATPCVFYARGTNYMPMAELIQDLVKAKQVPQKKLVKLSLKREKNEGVTYWQVVPAIADENVEITAKDFGIIKEFALTIAAENEEIYTKWKKHRISNAVEAKGTADVLEKDVELPFNDSIDDLNPDNVLAAG